MTPWWWCGRHNVFKKNNKNKKNKKNNKNKKNRKKRKKRADKKNKKQSGIVGVEIPAEIHHSAYLCQYREMIKHPKFDGHFKGIKSML